MQSLEENKCVYIYGFKSLYLKGNKNIQIKIYVFVLKTR